MNELFINDAEANRLIKMLKTLFNEHGISIHENCEGEIPIKGSDSDYFLLNYRITPAKTVLNFRECRYNYSLLRININDSFHKNADGSRIHGPRINIFSEEEYYSKGDGVTYYKAHHLPYDSIPNTDDFYDVLTALLKYTNTNNITNITIQQSMF
ncbi:DUF6978 family protein [Aerococcus kribbianus]|uniref:Uncharacterized protein n=1 Tax=Aerococcus kribbianus TaxID=2999064 RepID=A0A9X3FNM1_9LACT|nr:MULTISPECIES: hypothetical protein [unclassified Aerococcus]MCZ0717868.1 hypothetical protein [Aerococcus sp. YH-aer221]MCZ0726155.1 hypothetical protein [Aerococcus sp. YH-aer222]